MVNKIEISEKFRVTKNQGTKESTRSEIIACEKQAIFKRNVLYILF